MADCKAWLASQGSGSSESKSCQPRIEISGLKGSENDLNGLYTFAMDNGKVQKNEEHPIYKQRVSFQILFSSKIRHFFKCVGEFPLILEILCIIHNLCRIAYAS